MTAGSENVRRTVLVVDDHQVVRNLLASLLRDAGLSVIEADSGARALQILKQHGDRIGCVLQDLSMPKMPGEEIIAKLLEFDPALPVVVMSVYDEATARVQLKELTIAGYAQKPFDTDKLIGDIRKLLDGWQQSGN